jgi:hypothetical protein
MQPIQDFMRDFFCARISEEQRHQASRAPYRQKFFTHDCQWDSRAGTLEMLQSEEVVSIANSDLESTVISAHAKPFYPADSRMHRFRYHLKAISDSWLISHVEIECLSCGGRGDENCLFCKGKHWV